MAGIRVSAPSHVHVGNYDIHGGLGRMYGTIGFTLEEPRTVVEVHTGKGVDGAPEPYYREWAERAVKVLEDAGCGRVGVTIRSVIPRNVGLGATTSLVLSIIAGGLRLCNRRARLEDLAARAGRGLVSALGVYSFIHGGFIVDGGFRPGSGRVPPLIFRATVPSRYVMVVALPEAPVEGILRIKEREDEVLESMPRMPEELAMKASRIALMGIIANAAEGDWVEAGRWVTRFNRLLGEYWADRQGGVYCCREAEEVVGKMLGMGALLAGQSSWGPTVYGLFPETLAPAVVEEVRSLLDGLGGGMVWATRVDNRGAVLEVAGDG
ncbi:MAG: GHMP kinase [Desulfurococcales archaeon]|nr:GHMP kinase [Desulfurococcales archaeon]